MSAPLPGPGGEGVVPYRERRRRGVNLVMLSLTGVAAALTVLPLLLILYYLLSAGVGALNAAFFSQLPAPPGMQGGGMANGMVGTLVMVGMAAAIGLPIAIGTGVFLAEAGSTRMASTVRFLADVMNGVPSIVVGVFVWAWVVLSMGRFSAFAGAVALAIMLLPMVTRTTEEMILMVPRELREGALALGLPRWRATLGVVLPAAASGILTGVLVALSRIAGETAPLLFTALGNPFWESRMDQPMAALPLQIFQYAISPYDDWHRQAWAGSLVLIALVFVVSLTARLFIRSPYART